MRSLAICEPATPSRLFAKSSNNRLAVILSWSEISESSILESDPALRLHTGFMLRFPASRYFDGHTRPRSANATPSTNTCLWNVPRSSKGHLDVSRIKSAAFLADTHSVNRLIDSVYNYFLTIFSGQDKARELVFTKNDRIFGVLHNQR